MGIAAVHVAEVMDAYPVEVGAVCRLAEPLLSDSVSAKDWVNGWEGTGFKSKRSKLPEVKTSGTQEQLEVSR